MNATLKADFDLNVEGALNNVKRELVGLSLASVDDYRVVALVVTGVLTSCFGALTIAAILSDKEEVKQLNFFKKAYSYLGGNVFLVAGILEILLSRFLITGIDEISYRALQELNYKK